SPEEFNLLAWHLSFKQNEVLKQWALYINNKNTTNYLSALILFSKAELYWNLLVSVNQLSTDQKDELLIKYPELLFPKPYWDLVTSYAAKRNIQPSFIYSIMRQESAFDPYARSPVDALGLLQLMPTLGKKLAKEENIQIEDEFDLFQPSINIALGSGELARLLELNQNKYIPAIASYNASKGAYNGWIKSRYRKDPIEFIEEIPYEETRTYIKLILRNMIFYNRLYFAKESFSFPNNWLMF
ncbi:MAG: lytic transglycosylase domain-containing protein, partial [Bdellovibrionales bacterium]|nr:lytic transglycosylase domain-containing protein [Bdellovibrionales bacterium]